MKFTLSLKTTTKNFNIFALNNFKWQNEFAFFSFVFTHESLPNYDPPIAISSIIFEVDLDIRK